MSQQSPSNAFQELIREHYYATRRGQVEQGPTLRCEACGVDTTHKFVRSTPKGEDVYRCSVCFLKKIITI